MGRKGKISIEGKVSSIEAYLLGGKGISQICSELSITKNSFYKWLNNYKENGVAGLVVNHKNKYYSEAIKLMAIKDYLAGVGSYTTLCKNYDITDSRVLRRWIKKYNGHEELKASGTGGIVIMTKGRKTTFEERVEIASYCISHDHNYAQTAEKFKVSYQQARNYTVKYEGNGIDALQDNRGKRKSGDSLTELERLRAELKLEKARREKAEMEASFLKNSTK